MSVTKRYAGCACFFSDGYLILCHALDRDVAEIIKRMSRAEKHERLMRAKVNRILAKLCGGSSERRPGSPGQITGSPRPKPGLSKASGPLLLDAPATEAAATRAPPTIAGMAAALLPQPSSRES